MNATIVVLPGDGIGPEVTAEAVRALEAVARKGGMPRAPALRVCSIALIPDTRPFT